MKVTHLKRRGGKTTRAVAECLKTGATLVVIHHRQAVALRHEYPGLRTATHDEFVRGDARLRGLREVIIDDVDYMLRQLAQGLRVRRITLSKPFTKAECKKYGIAYEGERSL